VPCTYVDYINEEEKENLSYVVRIPCCNTFKLTRIEEDTFCGKKLKEKMPVF
jgi:hypothetical protein